MPICRAPWCQCKNKIQRHCGVYGSRHVRCCKQESHAMPLYISMRIKFYNGIVASCKARLQCSNSPKIRKYSPYFKVYPFLRGDIQKHVGTRQSLDTPTLVFPNFLMDFCSDGPHEFEVPSFIRSSVPWIIG